MSCRNSRETRWEHAVDYDHVAYPERNTWHIGNEHLFLRNSLAAASSYRSNYYHESPLPPSYQDGNRLNLGLPSSENHLSPRYLPVQLGIHHNTYRNQYPAYDSTYPQGSRDWSSSLEGSRKSLLSSWNSEDSGFVSSDSILPNRRRNYSESSESSFDSMRSDRPPIRSSQTIASECEVLSGPRVALDSFNCDLFVTISDDGMTGYDWSADGFQRLWGGVRASHGVTHGKVAFEVTLLECLPTSNEGDEISQGGVPHVTRVGFSRDFSDYQLGESPHSFGFGGTGKKSVNKSFASYGCQFGVGDTVTCYLDKDRNMRAVISFAVNGRYFGQAFESDIQREPLFPHVCSKNMKYSVNFGAYPPRYPLLPGFVMVDACDSLVPAVKAGDNREDHEFIMLVGLPGTGKTHFIEQYVKDNPEKKYVVLGTNSIMEKMKVVNLKRKFNYHQRFEQLFQEANDILKVLMKFSENKLRNYILDQTNVFASARMRKKKAYLGYQSRCLVFVQGPEVLLQRTLQAGRVEGKWVPVSAVMNMKRNFKLPSYKEGWHSIQYMHKTEEQAREIVERFNVEGEEFFKWGEDKKPENNEVPPPKYLAMLDKDSDSWNSLNSRRMPDEIPAKRSRNDACSYGNESSRPASDVNDLLRNPREQTDRLRNSREEPDFGQTPPIKEEPENSELLQSRYVTSTPNPHCAINSGSIKQEPNFPVNPEMFQVHSRNAPYIPNPNSEVIPQPIPRGVPPFAPRANFQSDFRVKQEPDLHFRAPAQPPFRPRIPNYP